MQIIMPKPSFKRDERNAARFEFLTTRLTHSLSPAPLHSNIVAVEIDLFYNLARLSCFIFSILGFGFLLQL